MTQAGHEGDCFPFSLWNMTVTLAARRAAQRPGTRTIFMVNAVSSLIGNVLRGMGYDLQANSKTREGSNYIDRDAQFQYINTQAKTFLTAHQPVIPVDTKKEELQQIPIKSRYSEKDLSWLADFGCKGAAAN
jgi:hypothetical protein